MSEVREGFNLRASLRCIASSPLNSLYPKSKSVNLRLAFRLFVRNIHPLLVIPVLDSFSLVKLVFTVRALLRLSNPSSPILSSHNARDVRAGLRLRASLSCVVPPPPNLHPYKYKRVRA